jgi:Tfp pilus assembly protein PilO
MNAKSLVIILCILASVLIIWQLILPVYDKISVAKEEVSQAQKKVEKLEELEKKLKELNQVYKEKEDLINKLYKIMPKNKDIPEILNRFESLSLQSGVILASIDFVEAEKTKKSSTASNALNAQGAAIVLAAENPPEKLGLDIRVSGTYEAFRGFLNNLENCVRLANVKKLDFSFKGEGSDLADFDITADVYYK